MSEGFLALPSPSGRRIQYDTGPSQFGRLYLPSAEGPHPTALLLHGGYWRARYGLAYMGHAAAALAAAGFAVWNVEYRRTGEPGGGWPGTFLDAAVAADVLRRLAPEHHLDLTRVIGLGHSAGGHLALWLAGRARLPSGSPLWSESPLPLLGVIALAPVADLIRGWELHLSEGAVALLLGGTPHQVPDRYAAASPIEFLPLGVPQVLLHGSDDEDVPIELSQRYATAAVAAGDAVRLLALPGTGHFELVDPRTPQWEYVVQAAHDLSAVPLG